MLYVTVSYRISVTLLSANNCLHVFSDAQNAVSFLLAAVNQATDQGMIQLW